MTATDNGALNKALIRICTQCVTLLQIMVILASLPRSRIAHIGLAGVPMTVMTVITTCGAISSEEHIIVKALVNGRCQDGVCLQALLVKVPTNV